MPQEHLQWTLARRPSAGLPQPGDFALGKTSVPEPGPNQMLTRTLYLSMDPYQWGRRRGGLEAVGEVCHGRTVSQVVASRIPAYAAGDFVFNTNGWQEYGLTGEGISVFSYMFPRKIDPSVAPISTAVGVFGMLGLTAYAGVRVQCRPRPGETVVVSAASGGVGQAAGQIARLSGCRVVGIAGIQDKCDYVTRELGFEACVSHHRETLAEDLRAACPDGVDVYFENVGGKVFEAVLPLLNEGSRIARCGLASQTANTSGGDPGVAWMAQGQPTFERKKVEVHGLHVRNFVADYQERFLAEMADWIRAGAIKYREDVWHGLEQAPAAFRAVLEGQNFGKTLVAVAADPTQAHTSPTGRSGRNSLS